MRKRSVLLSIPCITMAAIAAASYVLQKKDEETRYSAYTMEPIPIREKSFYERHVKRMLDIVCSSAAATAFMPLYAAIAVLVRIKLGTPVLFVQERPGLAGEDGRETVFRMYKFRSMTDERDSEGNLLPDEVRLTSFGKKLRSTSLDELPELINILNGSMSIIGPRPQLVRDMVFMSGEQRMRHSAKPGLSGLAQVRGRNAISWEEKIDWDLRYIENVSLTNDLMIIWETVRKVLLRTGGTDTLKEVDLALDYGDDLLERGMVSRAEYDLLQDKARDIMKRRVK